MWRTAVVCIAAVIGTLSRDAARRPDQVPGAPARPVAPTARIAGTIVNADSKTPMADASVFLQASETGSVVRSIRTARDGRFDFQQLSPGRYWITATRPGFARVIYGQKRPGRPGMPIDHIDGQSGPARPLLSINDERESRPRRGDPVTAR